MLAIDIERKDTKGYLGDGARVPDQGKIDHLWLFVRDSGGNLEAAFYTNRRREQHRRLKRLDLGKRSA